MGLWSEKRFQAFAYFESQQEYQDAEAAAAEFVEPGAFTGDFLDIYHSDFVGNAVADNFCFYAFNCIAKKFVTIFHIALADEDGVAAAVLEDLIADIHRVEAHVTQIYRVRLLRRGVAHQHRSGR